MEKAPILTEKQIAEAKNPILEEDWPDYGQYLRGVTGEEKDIAEYARDYYHQYYLKKFKEVIEWLKSHNVLIGYQSTDQNGEVTTTCEPLSVDPYWQSISKGAGGE